MEDQNLNLPAAMSPTSTQDGSETNNNVPVATEVARVVDVGSDTGAKSGPAPGSNFPPMKRGRGRPRKHEVRGNQPAPVQVTPAPELAIQPFGSEEKRGRGRPRGSGKLQMLASIGIILNFYFIISLLVLFFVFMIFFFLNIFLFVLRFIISLLALFLCFHE
jgi:hypothetical protein